MATKLSDAVLRIQLDPEGAKAEVRVLEEKVRAVEEARGKEAAEDKARASKKDAEKDEKKKTETATKGGGKFTLPPLTAPDFLGAIPLVGGLAKTGASLVQRFGPLASGIAQGFGENVPEGVKSYVAKAVEGTLSATGAQLNAFDAKLRAIQSTFEQVKQVAKAQLLLAGKVDTTAAANFLTDEFTIQSKLQQFERFVEDQTLRELGRGGQKAMIDALRKISRVN